VETETPYEKWQSPQASSWQQSGCQRRGSAGHPNKRWPRRRQAPCRLWSSHATNRGRPGKGLPAVDLAGRLLSWIWI
jgi:hypothetical protein